MYWLIGGLAVLVYLSGGSSDASAGLSKAPAQPPAQPSPEPQPSSKTRETIRTAYDLIDGITKLVESRRG